MASGASYSRILKPQCGSLYSKTIPGEHRVDSSRGVLGPAGPWHRSLPGDLASGWPAPITVRRLPGRRGCRACAVAVAVACRAGCISTPNTNAGRQRSSPARRQLTAAVQGRTCSAQHEARGKRPRSVPPSSGRASPLTHRTSSRNARKTGPLRVAARLELTPEQSAAKRLAARL